jgi:hypothetical protein
MRRRGRVVQYELKLPILWADTEDLEEKVDCVGPEEVCEEL